MFGLVCKYLDRCLKTISENAIVASCLLEMLKCNCYEVSCFCNNVVTCTSAPSGKKLIINVLTQKWTLHLSVKWILSQSFNKSFKGGISWTCSGVKPHQNEKLSVYVTSQNWNILFTWPLSIITFFSRPNYRWMRMLVFVCSLCKLATVC